MITPVVFLYYFEKEYNIVNIKILTFFIGPLQQFFLTNDCFSSSSINAKQKSLLNFFFVLFFQKS